MMAQPRILPLSQQEGRRLGIEEFDIILVSGDAYVDHPSFGMALIGRVLWNAGYSVGIISQPDWKKDEDFCRLGRPRLFFGISSGNVDSMVNNLTPNLKRRSSDVYSPGGVLRRPDRALIVYANKVHSLFPGTPIILGGIEASLRRFAHYDYWSDSVRQSILADAPGDLLVYGMGERPLLEVAMRLETGERISEIRDVAGTTVKEEPSRWRSAPLRDCQVIPGYIEASSDKKKYAQAFRMHYEEQDPFRGRTVVQPHPKTIIIQNKPALPLAAAELDHIYELPFCREAHPSYREPVPALEPVRFSITSHRGCFGSCSFCALTHHQGRIVQSRSIDSIVREAVKLTKLKGFGGIIQDVGGPTANMYGLVCPRWGKLGACSDKLCSADCPSMSADHSRLVELLRRLRGIPGVKRVFIGSGIRHDLIMADSSPYLQELCQYHVSGHLKIAPEHISPEVTACMHKPPREVLDAFRERFSAASRTAGKEQYVLPYLMSGHPGCTVRDMVDLAEYLRDNHLYTEQVQDFTPTPLTVSTAMYYTGQDPFTGKMVHVPKGREKRIQRAMLQYRDPKNYDLVREGLRMAGREDLVGDGRRCLIPEQRWRARTGKKGNRTV
ncbi:Ribosomal protein S12 methylthiotransferase RimO [uncultured archaeon]|nr:Ribosomal protein S12 methylthiotransferase RimO [uncultured archaeon]